MIELSYGTLFFFVWGGFATGCIVSLVIVVREYNHFHPKGRDEDE